MKKRGCQHNNQEERNNKRALRQNPFVMVEDTDSLEGISCDEETKKKDKLSLALLSLMTIDEGGGESKVLRRDVETKQVLSLKKLQSIQLVLDNMDFFPGYNYSNMDDAYCLTDSDLASILLPFATKCLLFLAGGENDPKELELFWNVLAKILQLLVGENSDVPRNYIDTTLGNIVTRSMVHKLIPFALSCCGNNEFSNRVNAAATTLTLILSHKNFTPELDFLCESLLVNLAKQVSYLSTTEGYTGTSGDSSQKIEIGKFLPLEENTRQQQAFEMVATSSLQLLLKKQQSLSLGTTPKKIFQILASKAVFLAIAKLFIFRSQEVQDLIKNILWKAFFDPTQHLDGFRSIKFELPDLEEKGKFVDGKGEYNSKKKISCYQEMLIKSFHSLLKVFCASDSNPMDLFACGSMVKVLGRGFCAQTTTWREETLCHGKSKNKNGSLAMISTLQFRFLAGLMGPLLRLFEEHQNARNDNNLFTSFTHCLGLMLEFDSYHPTYEDFNQQHFCFLKSLYQHIFHLLVKYDDAATSEILIAIEHLIKLNHLTVHDQLPELIAQVALSCGKISHHYLESLNNLVDTLFKTYQQLRQLDYLLHSFVDSYNIFIKTSSQPNYQPSIGVSIIVKALQHSKKTISLAITSAPYGQIQPLFETFNNWIATHVNKNIGDNKSTPSFLFIVIELFVMLLRNIRVDEYTSREVSSLCHHSLSNSVLGLLEKVRRDVLKDKSQTEERNINTGNEQFVKGALFLYGWLIDLQNRCSFWHSSEDESVLTTELCTSSYTYIESLLEELLGETNSSLVLIAPQELQFLAFYRIQQLHSLIYETQKEELSLEKSNKKDFLREAKRLVDFVFTIFVKNSTSCDSKNLLLDDRDQQLLALLSQFLPVWTPYCRKQHACLFLEHIFQTIVVHNHSLVVTMLLQDASFFEIEILHPGFLEVGIECVQELLHIIGSEGIFNKNNTEDIEAIGRLQFFSVIQTKENSDKASLFQGIHKILMALNSGSHGYRFSDNAAKLFCPLLEIDFALCLHIKKESFFCEVVLALSTCRQLFSKITYESDPFSLAPQEKERFSRLVMNIMTSTQETLLLCEENLQQNPEQLLCSLCELIGAAAFTFFRGGDDPSLVKINLQEVFVKNVIKPNYFDFDRVGNLLLDAVVVGAKEAMMSHNKEAVYVCGKFVLNQICSLKEHCNVKDIPSFLKLIGTIWSCCCETENDTTICYDLISQYLAIPDTLDKVEPKALSQLLWIFLKNDAVDQVPKHLCSLILLKIDNCSVEICMLCKLVLKSEISEYNEFLVRILSTPILPIKSVNIMLLLLRSVKEYEKHKLETAKFGPKILNAAVNSLKLRQDNVVKVVSELLLEIMKHKDMVVIKERDIARILSQISCLLDSMRNISSREYGSESFSSLCELVITLVHRFPKQLYVCIASLILTLQKLFCFIYSRTYELEELEVREAAQNLSRLCEMLLGHSEAIKKYIFVLILDFVDVLAHGLDQVYRKMITPSIYILLDITSENEMSQLNSLLDPTGRALFRSFYDGYRKQHVYRGT